MSNQRGLVQRIERMLEDGVGDAFARVFGGSIVPQELEALLRREASDGVQRLAGERFLAPNEYVITLSTSDFGKLSADRDLTAQTFARHLAGYIEEQGWQTYGDVVVRLDQSEGLHTGQYRARAVVNPDADPRPSASAPAAAESNQASTAEPGVPAMTDNPTYRGEPGQGRPGDENYDDQYGRPQEEQRPPYQEQGGQGGQGGHAPSYEQGYPPRPAYPSQGGYPEQGYGQGYAQGPYDQRPPAGYAPQGGGQGYDQGYRQPPPPGYGPPGYGPPPGGGYPPPAGDYDYGRPRHEEPGYGRPEARPVYPDQGYQQPGYQQPGYGGPYGQQPEYGQPDYGRYDQGGYTAAPAAPAAPAGDYDYGQGYGGYAPPAGQGEYASTGRTVTLQLDDGSGRTYQLREGANVIGRGQDAQFRLPDTGVSRRHLEIRWDGQAALLSDLNSTNGTTVNNSPVQEWQLADGDVIRVGHSEIIVHLR
jgi:hypothetical protein